MKTTIILGLTLFVAVLFCSFDDGKLINRPTTSAAVPPDSILTYRPNTAVCLDSVIKSIERYNRIAGFVFGKLGASQSDLIRAYTIPKRDLLGVLGADTSTYVSFLHCRVYLGLDSIPVKKGYELKYKLFMVPVYEGNDFILYCPKSKGNNDTLIPFAYDLITPCPNSCDYGSPLYTFSERPPIIR